MKKVKIIIFRKIFTFHHLFIPYFQRNFPLLASVHLRFFFRRECYCFYFYFSFNLSSFVHFGNIFSSFIEAVGRNPAARSEVFTMTMLGFALVEAIALFALVIALVILFG